MRIQEQQPDFRKKEGQGKKRVEVESGGKKGKNTKRHEDHERKRELLRHCCSLCQQQQVFFPWAAAAITSTVVPRQQLPPPPPQLQDQDLAKTEGTKATLMNHTKTAPRPPRPETSTNAKTNRLKQICLIGRHGQRWLVCTHDATEFRIFIATFNCWGVFTVSTCLF